MGEWSQIRIGNLGRVVTGRTPPKNDPAYFDGDVNFLTPTDLGDRRRVESTARTLSPFGAQNLSRCLVTRGVSVSCIGWQMGKSVLIDRPTVTNQQMNSIIIDENIADSLFVYYALSSRRQEIFELGAGGSRTPILNKGEFEKLLFSLPEMPEQLAISSVLGALDDKIELNQRMNDTLEAMARRVFKNWFVDFGPTHAKMEGRAPHLSPDIWSLFPDHLDDEGKPRGWTSSTIGQEVDVLGGSTPSTNEPQFWGGDVAWATPKDLSSLTTPVLLSTERQITETGLSQIGSGLLPVGTVLLSSRAPIGYMAIAQIPVAVNQGFIAMICRKRLSNVFVWLWTQANIETVHQNANGSTFQEISKANFRPIAVTVPTPDILRAFDDTVKPLFDRIVSNEKENRSLAATRDFLLPKLMSGEVRVGDAAQIA